MKYKESPDYFPLLSIRRKGMKGSVSTCRHPHTLLPSRISVALAPSDGSGRYMIFPCAETKFTM
ncbi:hypothetical protein [Hoylesella marshii]|uniref:hypothetical protein n=1 Tax=Hoylesella marshii TaxID=189722 RepID=UPI0012DCAEB9|nr:hypothetical protein [Hoylesella marshii]